MSWIKLVLPSDDDKSLVPEITGIRQAIGGLNFATLSLIAVLAILGIYLLHFESEDTTEIQNRCSN